MSELSKEDYLKTLRTLENSPADRIGSLGKLGVVATGSAAGALGAGTVASFFGATTILGSSTLASLAGGVLVATTPVGWILATAAAGGAAAYGISKLISSGGANDEKKRTIILDLKSKIDSYADDVEKAESSNKIAKVAGAYALLLENNLMEQEKITVILSGVEDGSIDANYALTIAQDILEEIQDSSIESLETEANNMLDRSLFVLLYKHLMALDGTISDSELTLYYQVMHNTFKCPKEYAQQLMDDAPSIENLEDTLEEVKNIVPQDKYDLLVGTLVDMANSDGEYHPKEKALIEKVKEVLQP